MQNRRKLYYVEMKDGSLLEGFIISHNEGDFVFHDLTDGCVHFHRSDAITFTPLLPLTDGEECPLCNGAHKEVDCDFRQIEMGDRLTNLADNWFRI